MAPGVCLMVAVTPSFLGARTILSDDGHCTELPVPGSFLNASLTADRWLVKAWVVPELSDRTTTVLGVSGSVTAGFAAAMRWPFQLVISPRKIAGQTSRGSFSSFTFGRL